MANLEFRGARSAGIKAGGVGGVKEWGWLSIITPHPGPLPQGERGLFV